MNDKKFLKITLLIFEFFINLHSNSSVIITFSNRKISTLKVKDKKFHRINESEVNIVQQEIVFIL